MLIQGKTREDELVKAFVLLLKRKMTINVRMGIKYALTLDFVGGFNAFSGSDERKLGKFRETKRKKLNEVVAIVQTLSHSYM